MAVQSVIVYNVINYSMLILLFNMDSGGNMELSFTPVQFYQKIICCNFHLKELIIIYLYVK